MSMFDDIIKEKADQHQAPVPPDAWDNIINKKKRRRFAFWWLPVLLLMGSGVYYWYSQATIADQPNLAQHTQQSPSEKVTKDMAPGNSSKPSNNDQYVLNGDQPQSNIGQQAGTNKTSADEKNITQFADETITGKKNGMQATTIAAEAEKNQPVKKGSVNNNNFNQQKIAKKLSRSEDNQTLFAERKIAGKRKGSTKVKTNQVAAEEVEDDRSADGLILDVANNPVAKSEVEKSDPSLSAKPTVIVTDTAAKQIAASKKNVADTSPQKKNEQVTSIKKSKQKSWSLEAGITPLFPFENYSNAQQFNRTLFLNNTLTEFSGNLESTSIDASVAFSVMLKKRVHPKLSVGAGLQYLQLKERVVISGNEKSTTTNIVQRLVNGVNGPELVNDTLQIVTQGKRSIKATNSYVFFSIPVMLQYSFVQKHNWSLSAVGGAYINISSRYQDEINRDALSPLINTSQASTGVGVDLSVGCRAAKTVSQRLEFFALPALRWNLGDYNIKNNLVNKTIHQAGLTLGLSFKLN